MLQPRSYSCILVKIQQFDYFKITIRMRLTCFILGTRNGFNASIVTTHGEMLVLKFLARNGPNGTYSHFCISLAIRLLTDKKNITETCHVTTVKNFTYRVYLHTLLSLKVDLINNSLI